MFIEKPLEDAIREGRPRGLLYGVAINNAPYITKYQDGSGKVLRCPYYMKWYSMLNRVYSPKYNTKTYSGCTIEPAWLSFMTFRSWMMSQDWEGKELDKDLLYLGNKHYGPDTCLFVPQALNKLLCLRGNDRGTYPLGVSEYTWGNRTRFRAQCSFYGKQTQLGYFDTVVEAENAYKQAKLAYITELALQQTDPRIKQAMLNLF